MLTESERELIAFIESDDVVENVKEIQRNIDSGYDGWRNPETRSRIAISDAETLMGVCRRLPSLLAIIERLEEDLKDVREQLRGLPESLLTGPNGLAAATMRQADCYEESLGLLSILIHAGDKPLTEMQRKIFEIARTRKWQC